MRLGVAFAFVVVLWLSVFRGALTPWWLLAPAVSFLALVAMHLRVREKRRRAIEGVAFYEDGLARVEDRWMGRRRGSDRFEDDSHLYAADLNIFGAGSLFELLSTARTRAGEETLAGWLTTPASQAEIQARQEAVEELRGRIDLREDLAVLGAGNRSPTEPERLVRWTTMPSIFPGRHLKIIFPLLAAVVFASLLAVWLSDTDRAWLAFYGSVSAAGLVGLFYRTRVRQTLSAAQDHAGEIDLLSQVLARLEREQFRSPKLVAMRASLETAGSAPSSQAARFARLVDLANWRRTELPLTLIILYKAGLLVLPFTFALWLTQVARAMDAWRSCYGPAVGRWAAAVGEFEALCALAGYAYEHPADPFPEVVDSGPFFHGMALRHPLIAQAASVPNTVRLGPDSRLLVVSGSNMSGKSTLLRTVGVNVVLALAGAPVRAERLRLSTLDLGATIRIQDSLQAGTSRFYAEIQRIRQIMDQTDGPDPVLFLLDEILQGTNSDDRAQGAEAIIRSLIRRGAIGLVTTHDLALAKVADALAPLASNVHFADRLEDGRLVFDYRMRPGIVRRSNALELMRAVGLDVDGDHRQVAVPKPSALVTSRTD
ncbi:MAG: MutS-related protein [Longimicrobiales bacterium]